MSGPTLVLRDKARVVMTTNTIIPPMAANSTARHCHQRAKAALQRDIDDSNSEARISPWRRGGRDEGKIGCSIIDCGGMTTALPAGIGIGAAAAAAAAMATLRVRAAIDRRRDGGD